MLRTILASCTALLVAFALRAQGPLAVRDSAELQILLDRLQVVGSVLYVAAHPDDENTQALAALAKGRKVRAAYLSLTRGGGGQNLIGAELDDLLAAVRTQELLAARRIDGAEQFFTGAVDFGYSKTPEETLRFWGRERILADVVRVYRAFQPDVILTRFPTDGRGGHGHHTASAVLALEAFAAAADPKRFPEQVAQGLRPWQPTRILFNTFRFQEGQPLPKDAVPFEVGGYDPLLGRSHAELSAEARSQHRSQGFGVTAFRGARLEHFELMAGAPARNDILEGVELGWKRLAGGAPVGALLAKARAAYRPDAPEAALPALLEAREALQALPKDPRTLHKAAELDEAIRCAAGLWVEAIADRPAAAPGEKVPVALLALARGRTPVRLESVALEGDGARSPAQELAPNRPWRETLQLALPVDAKPTTPSWAAGGRAFLHGTRPAGFETAPEDPPAFTATFRATLLGRPFELRVPVLHRFRDPVLGERAQAFLVQPPVLVQVPALARIFPDGQPREIHLEVTPARAKAAGRLRIQVPAGWRAEPAEWSFDFAEANAVHRLAVKITPGGGSGDLSVTLDLDGLARPAFGKESVSHPHIPVQTLFHPAKLRLVRTEAKVAARRVGYIMGAGDDGPPALRMLGCEVELLSDEALAERDLSAFDAIVVGIRAFNTRPALARVKDRLRDYVAQGGTEIVQYQVNGAFPGTNAGLATEALGPFPFKVGRERVTDESAAPVFLDPKHPALTWPNALGAADFDGWVQERGLYFAASWDPRYAPLLALADPGEKPLEGGLLVAKHGKGHFVYTGLAFFRQLPDGVPGAYRLFANLLSLGKAPSR